MTKLKLLLFTMLLSATGIAQVVDSVVVQLREKIEVAKTDSIKVTILLELSEYQLDRDFTSTVEATHKALTIIKSDQERLNKGQLATAYTLMGIISRRQGNYVESLQYYQKAKLLYEDLHDIVNVSSVLHNMGLLYRSQKQHQKAINHYKEAIGIKEKLPNQTYEIACGYNMLGVTYKKLKKIDSAMWCYQKAEDLFKPLNKEEDIYGVHNNKAALYMSQKSYDKALAIFLESYDYYKSIGNLNSLATCALNIANVYKKLGQYDKALKYVEETQNITKQEGYKVRLSKAYLKKSYLYSKTGNYKGAYDYYRMFNRLSDSIYNIDNIKKVQALELSYEFNQEKLADSLQFVTEKKELALLKKTEESKKQFYIILFLITFVGGIVITFLIKKNFRARSLINQAKFQQEKVEKELLAQQLKRNEDENKRLIADNSMRLAFKQGLLDQLKKVNTTNADIDTFKGELSSLIIELQQQVATEHKLSNLQEKIDEVNQGFEKMLINKYPSLTKTEREICSLLRLNLSIKEIMTIRKSSLDSVKSARYRIRKKMNLSSGEELERFIQNLDE